MTLKQFIPLLLFFTSCSFSNQNKQLNTAFSLAGGNRIELKKVLIHYQNEPEKLSAAQFLIRNMPYHFSNESYYARAKDERYYPDITQFTDADAVRRHCDSLQRKGWSIREERRYDIRELKADFLTRNIDLAFEAWGKQWAREVPFETFCRYILPYRAQNEPVSDLRETLMRRYLPLLDSVQPQNPLEACRVINAQLAKEIRYKETGHTLQPTLEEMERAGIGTCDALCNYTTFVMRAVGIPVAVHQTTWTRMDRGHTWCAVWHDGRFYDFSPGDQQPDVYPHTLATTRYLKPAKVYRRHFDADLSVLPETDDGYVTHLRSPLLEDATDEGELPTYPLCIPANRKATNPSGLVYLCAYNYYAWQPIAIGRREGDSCRFEQVAGRNFFLVAEAADKENLRFISAPVFTEGDGRFHTLQADTARCVAATLMRTMGEQPQILSYWDTEMNRFVPLAYCQLTDSTQRYDNIPDNALLWYRLQRQELGQRVGMLVNGLFKKTYDF